MFKVDFSKNERFVISQAAIIIRGGKCLIIEFFDHTGWGLPGGRIDKGELGPEAFRREIKEEINCQDFDIITVIDYDTWNPDVPVCATATLIDIKDQEIKLSHEHCQAKWISEDEIDDYSFVWPNAKRMITKGFAYIKLLEKYKI